MKNLGKLMGTLGIITAAYAPSLMGQTPADSVATSPVVAKQPVATSAYYNAPLAKITFGQSQWGNQRLQSLRVVYNNQKMPIVFDFSEVPGRPNELTTYTKFAEAKLGKSKLPVEFIVGAGLSMDGATYKDGVINTRQMGFVGKVGAVVSKNFGKQRDLSARVILSQKISQKSPTMEAGVSGSYGVYSFNADALVNPNKSSTASVMVGRKMNSQTEFLAGFETAKMDKKYVPMAKVALRVKWTSKFIFNQMKKVLEVF